MYPLSVLDQLKHILSILSNQRLSCSNLLNPFKQYGPVSGSMTKDYRDVQCAGMVHISGVQCIIYEFRTFSGWEF